jgi:hypothetical protein
MTPSLKDKTLRNMCIRTVSLYYANKPLEPIGQDQALNLTGGERLAKTLYIYICIIMTSWCNKLVKLR